MRTLVSDYTPLSLIPRLSCMGTQEPGNEAGHYCVVMSNSVLLSVYTCYSGYTAEFAAQLVTTTYDSASQSLKLSNSEKQVHMHSRIVPVGSLSFGWCCHHGCQYGCLQALISNDPGPS